MRSEKPKKVFLSDWELKRMLRPGESVIRVPRGAIISPLARDWLDFEDITVVFDQAKRT